MPSDAELRPLTLDRIAEMTDVDVLNRDRDLLDRLALAEAVVEAARVLFNEAIIIRTHRDRPGLAPHPDTVADLGDAIAAHDSGVVE